MSPMNKPKRNQKTGEREKKRKNDITQKRSF